MLNDVGAVDKPDGNAIQGQSAKNEILQHTGEPSYLLRLGTDIAKQTKSSIKMFSGSVDKFVSFKATIERVKQRGIYDENEILHLLLDLSIPQNYENS